MKKIPSLVRSYYSQLTWNYPATEKVVYLTFDDGPTPEISAWVLDMLDTFGAKGTFFVLGKNVEQEPEIVHRMIDTGHGVGNHGYAHLDGWKTPLRTYLRDFLMAQRSIYEYTGKQAKLFRPAYGHITQTKARYIQRSHQIIMMDILSGDFDQELSADEVSKTVLQHVKPGSIVVFHDSQKAFPRLEKALPKVLLQLEEEGYEFPTLPIRQRAIQG